VDGGEYAASVHVRSHSRAVDIAILSAPRLPDVSVLECAQLDRGAPHKVSCYALGYPVWKVGQGATPARAQVDGYLPTAEGGDPSVPDGAATALTLRITGQQIRERTVPSGALDQKGSEWAGMSGAVVVTDEDLVVAASRWPSRSTTMIRTEGRATRSTGSSPLLGASLQC